MKKTAALSGATGKIGGAICEGLLQRGYKVILLCRNAEKMEKLMYNFRNKYGEDSLSSYIVDLSEKSSIENMLSQWKEPINVLVNNAACTPQNRRESSEGVEMQWAVNVLAYFRLMNGLSPFLETDGYSRIVNVASYWAGGMDLSDPEFKKRRYNNDSAYRQSKQADRMLTAAFAEKFESREISVNACHPGDVLSTLSRNLGFGGHESPVQGAETPLFLAADSSLDGLTGRYYEHKRESFCSFMKDAGEVRALYELCESY